MRRLLLILLTALLPTTALAVDEGDVVFTELMIAPATGTPEWLELLNPRGFDVDLDGCVLAEEGHDYTLPAVVIPAGQYALFSKGDDCAIFDVGGTCVQASAVTYTALTFNNGDPETLSLTCGQDAAAVVVDQVTYDWTDFDADCIDGSSCSVNLDADFETATANDAWADNWCIPPNDALVFDEAGGAVLATPWAEGECPEPGPACAEGDVLFTELMVAPPTATREWFEMKVTTGSGCDLQACEFWEGPGAIPPYAEAGDDDDSAGDDDDGVDPCDSPQEDWKCHRVDAPGNSLMLGFGTYALFSKGADTVVGQPGDDPVIYSHYRYGDVSFGNSDLGYLHLVCEDTLIESVPYDWEVQEAGCEGSCSLNLPVVNEDEETNDDLADWCLPPDDVAYTSSDDAGTTFFATPGAAGACLERDWPTAGDVLFSELMIAPLDTAFPEWFELANVTDQPVELAGCELRRYKAPPEPVEEDDDDSVDDDDSAAVDDDDDDDPVPADYDAYSIGETGTFPVIQPGSALVFVKSKCIDGGEASTAGTCSFGEDQTHHVYGGFSFSNGDETEQLTLVCPVAGGVGGDPVEVDRAVYNQQRMADRSGHAMEFDVSREGAADLNDDLEEWCEASFDDCIPGTVTEEGECHFGTPGDAGPCKTGLVDVPPSGPGCRCDGLPGRSRTGAGLLLTALGLLLLLRRRLS
jgi:hypothetical protein